LFAVRHLPSTVCLADLPAHHAQHIRQSPRRQLGCFYGYGYRAPGNIFINQLHRLLPWDNLDLLTKWFSKKTVLKKVQEKSVSAIKSTKTGQKNQSLFSK